MSILYSQSLVAFLSAVKVQSRNVSLSYAGLSICENVDGNYLRIDCSATKTSLNDSSQCEARADASSKSESKVKTIYKLGVIGA